MPIFSVTVRMNVVNIFEKDVEVEAETEEEAGKLAQEQYYDDGDGDGNPIDGYAQDSQVMKIEKVEY
jgi:hypothetical protein